MAWARATGNSFGPPPAQNQTQTKQLTADDVSKAAKTYDSDKGDKNPARLVKALDTLGTDFTGTGATVQSGAKESGVKMPGAAEKVLGNVDSISRSGDTVTITNQKSITVDGVAKLDKTISFKVVSVDGKPALHDISGIHLGVGKGWAFVVLDTPKSWGP